MPGLLCALTPEVQGALVGALLGGLIGIAGSLGIAWMQYSLARRQLLYEDQLERKRDADREEREFQWHLQRIAAERANRPILRLTIDAANRDCVYAHHYETQEIVSRFVTSTRRVQKTDWYLSVLVENRGPVSAVNCKGQLESIDRWQEGAWVNYPVHGPLDLHWAYGTATVDLAPGAAKALNTAVASEIRRPLRITTPGDSQLVVDAVSRIGTFRLTVIVAAENADAQRICLGINWDESWPGYWSEQSFFDATILESPP
jgi:hypothetical protein